MSEVENSSLAIFAIFLALWLNLCNNSNQTLLSNALTFEVVSPLNNFGKMPSGMNNGLET